MRSDRTRTAASMHVLYHGEGGASLSLERACPRRRARGRPRPRRPAGGPRAARRRPGAGRRRRRRRRPAARTAASRSPTRSPTTPTTRTSSCAGPRRGRATCSTRARPAARRRPPSASRAGARRSRPRRAAPGVDPDLLEALVFLESAGREDAIAGDTEGAVGLTPDPRRDRAEPARDAGRRRRAARRLTRRIGRAVENGRDREGRGAAARAARGRRALRPGVKALAGTARYLTIAQERARPRGPRVRLLPHGDRQPPGRARAYGEERPSYARVYFDSTPDRHADRAAPADGVRRRLVELPVEALRGARDHAPVPRRPGRAGAARRRCRPQELGRGGAAPARRDAAVRHPDGSSRRRGTTDRSARSRTIRRSPAWRATGAWASSRSGSARRPRLYRGLRPEALAMALYIGAQVREYAGGDGAADRHLDRARRGLPAPARAAGNREATRNYSLHTTGWAFDVARDYASRAPGARVPVRARPPPGART